MCDVPCSAHRLKPAGESDRAIYKAIAENLTPMDTDGPNWRQRMADVENTVRVVLSFAAPQAQQPAVEPYGHVTVSRLSQRFENHADQYTFYPAGQVPYMDNVDECVPVFTSPPPPADVPLLTDDEREEIIAAKSGYGRTNLNAIIRATEQAVRQKAGLK